MSAQKAVDEMNWILTVLRGREELTPTEWETLVYFFKKGIEAEFQTKLDEEV